MKNIFYEIKNKVETQILPFVPNKLRGRFLDGINMFGIKEFNSINSNGRVLRENRDAGEMAAYRCTRDSRFKGLILHIIPKFIKSDSITLCLDFSTFNKINVACLALQTGKGRAIPLWLKAYVKKPGKIKASLIEALDEFTKYLDPNIRVTLTMDRWFAIEDLFKFLDNKGIKFICRVKSSLPVTTAWEKGMKVLEISDPDTSCFYKDHKLRLIQSKWDSYMKEDEPWFLLTNDFDRTRQQILNKYKKRFEIEECFKDLKWIQRYEWQRIRIPLVLENILLFAFLGWWLLFDCGNYIVIKNRSKKINKHKKISIFRALLEAVRRDCFIYIKV